jgi:hypothetical protein
VLVADRANVQQLDDGGADDGIVEAVVGDER